MKMVEAPVLHVNGDDPEAVIRAARIAIEYRMFWKRDIAIDMICYRRLGHNEQDEPMATQPLMYRRIHALPSTRALYATQLAELDVVTPIEAESMIKVYKARLDAPASYQSGAKNAYAADWVPYRDTHWRDEANDRNSTQSVAGIGQTTARYPTQFHVAPARAKDHG
jgi:2-oxoglutarate dehydrogenase E1 component